jgi:hypothetical protein
MGTRLNRGRAFGRAAHPRIEPKLAYRARPGRIHTRCGRTVTRHAAYSVNFAENRVIPGIGREPLPHLLSLNGSRLAGEVAIEECQEFRVVMLHAPMTRLGLSNPQARKISAGSGDSS